MARSTSSEAAPQSAPLMPELTAVTADVAPEPHLAFDDSVGYQLRVSHRALQRYLQAMIQPHGVTIGMWYFLRALWDEDGQTQRELSRRIGTSEPTTLNAIAAMERSGLVTRLRDKTDGRKLNVLLTDKGRDLKSVLLPLAIHVVETATVDFTPEQRRALLDQLAAVQRNLAGAINDLEPTDIEP
jgi:MarR family transcriptional regulator, organic hydroperoxide resistance regulator